MMQSVTTFSTNRPRPNKCRICDCPEFGDIYVSNDGILAIRLFACGEKYSFRKHKWKGTCRNTWKTIKKLRGLISGERIAV
jgi:hypothetical protein